MKITHEITMQDVIMPKTPTFLKKSDRNLIEVFICRVATNSGLQNILFFFQNDGSGL